MQILIWGLVFVVSLFALVKSSDKFTDSAATLGNWLGLPSFLVGVVIVAAGTSLPELSSSLFAVWKGASEIVGGNVIGSNITNILLVIGLSSSWAGELVFKRDGLRADLWFLVAATAALMVFSMDGRISLPEGIVCLVMLAGYLLFCFVSERPVEEVPVAANLDSHSVKPGKGDVIKTLVILIICSAVIYLSSSFTVESVVRLAELIGVGPEVIAAGAVALGTSLPELAVSMVAARKGEADIAVGNVLGSNIFNTLAVIGAPTLMGVLDITRNMVLLGLPVMGAATIYLIFILRDRKVTRIEGAFALAMYVLFLSGLFVL